MKFYPFSVPQILDTPTFTNYGGKTGSFTYNQLQSSFLVAEQAISNYIGTLLVPTVVSGTFGYMGKQRIATDYGYVWTILRLDILSQNVFSSNCDLQSNSGCAFIWEDTFGYIDVRQALSMSNIGALSWFTGLAPLFPVFSPLANMTNPYQFRLSYFAGLPTGISMLPGVLEALTIVAQIDLNEKDPGNSGMNEGIGDVGITEFSDLGYRGYREKRKDSDIKRTILGSSPKANYAARLIDLSVKRCRPSLRM